MYGALCAVHRAIEKLSTDPRAPNDLILHTALLSPSRPLPQAGEGTARLLKFKSFGALVLKIKLIFVYLKIAI